MALRVTNTTSTAQALAEVRKALDDLYDQSNQAKAKALEVMDERSQRLGALIADLEVTASTVHWISYKKGVTARAEDAENR